MRGVILLLPLYSYMEWTDIALRFHQKYLSSCPPEKGRHKVEIREILGPHGCYIYIYIVLYSEMLSHKFSYKFSGYSED
jgi:hypothetical protein